MPVPSESIPPSLWKDLFKAASELAALKPWEFATDGDLLGVTDAVTKEIRVGHVLGNAGMVFGAVFYRRRCIPWLLSTLEAETDPTPHVALESMECIKVDYVMKAELTKEDLAAIAVVGFKPRGRGPVWPQFRSVRLGSYAWHLDAAEARQMVSDLGQLIAFFRLLKAHPSLFKGRDLTDIPFLRAGALEGSITLADLEWTPLVTIPDPLEDPDPVPESLLEALEKLDVAPNLRMEFDNRILLAATFNEGGRPCYGRIAMLADCRTGRIAGGIVEPATQSGARIFPLSLANLLLKVGLIPTTLVVLGSKNSSVLESVCKRLGIVLEVEDDLPGIDEATESLSESLRHHR